MSVFVRSKDTTNEEDVRDRNLHLGLFVDTITTDEIKKALTESDLWYRVVTTEALGTGRAHLYSIPRVIIEGLVFENTEELVQYLKSGLTYEDLSTGYQMASDGSNVNV